MAPRWDKRLRLPKSEGGATICEKHEFIEAHFRDPEMSWEVDQAVTQAKDDGKRMEARLQELGEEANNLEDALSETEADRDRIAAELQAVRDELKELRESVEWIKSVPPEEKMDQELHAASLLDLRRWERTRGPGAVGNPVLHYEDFLAFRARERGRKEAQEAMSNLQAELAKARNLIGIALPHVQASAGAEHMLDGFRPRRRPIDDDVDAIRAALANNAKDEA